MTVKLKQDRTRKGGFKGSLNAQDWPADRQTLPPITLATSNINNAKISAEIAARALTRINEPYYAAQVALMVKTLDVIVSTLKTREAK